MPSPRPTQIELLTVLLACACGQPNTDATATAATTGDSTSDPTGPTTGPTTGEPAEPGPCAVALEPVPRGDARLSVDKLGALRDQYGRDVQLRGVNTGGRNKYAPFLPFPVGPDPTVADVQASAPPFFARLHDWGLCPSHGRRSSRQRANTTRPTSTAMSP